MKKEKPENMIIGILLKVGNCLLGIALILEIGIEVGKKKAVSYAK